MHFRLNKGHDRKGKSLLVSIRSKSNSLPEIYSHVCNLRDILSIRFGATGNRPSALTASRAAGNIFTCINMYQVGSLASAFGRPHDADFADCYA